jgi:hypothetical protein
MSLGIGISVNNARAALAGFFGKPGEFERTPKFGVTEASDERWRHRVSTFRPRRKVKLQPFVELALGLYLLSCIALCFTSHRVTIGVVFVALFMAGYLYVSLMTWFGGRVRELAGASEPLDADLAMPDGAAVPALPNAAASADAERSDVVRHGPRAEQGSRNAVSLR